MIHSRTHCLQSQHIDYLDFPGQQKYRNDNIYRNFRDGKPVHLPDKLRECYNKCLDILQFTEVHRKMISPFSVFGYDLFHAGKKNICFYGIAIVFDKNKSYQTY